jgi:hypothetical protein
MDSKGESPEHATPDHDAEFRRIEDAATVGLLPLFFAVVVGCHNGKDTQKAQHSSLGNEGNEAFTRLKHALSAFPEGMARYVIPSANAFGAVGDIRTVEKRLGRNHAPVGA